MLWNNTNKGKEKINKRLQVPVRVEEFTWLRVTDSPSRYIYVHKDEREIVRVTMIDGNGIPLMSMCGVDFVETTASLVESMITSQSSQIPGLWEELWRHQPGPLESQVELCSREGAIFSEDVVRKAYEMNKLGEEDQSVYDHLNGITVVHFMNALYDLGWKPEVGKQFTLQELMTELSITESYTNFTRFFLNCLVADDNLSYDAPSCTFTILKSIPSKQELINALRYSRTTTETSRADYKTIYDIGAKLPDILLGKTPPLAILFPEGSNMALIDAVYELLHGVVTRSCTILINAIISRSIQGFDDPTHCGKLRLLEVGAGTGMHTGLFLNVLEDLGKYSTNYILQGCKTQDLVLKRIVLS